ncbi:MAG: hypothetical protein LBE50_05535, partial [Gallionellaceae bacterium]|nr:hypothetical protein [Gallionellaceae bacterium]
MRTSRIVFAAALAACLSMPALADISAAVADSARPAEDTARDAGRKPTDTLTFADIKPGMQIAELIPGGGYYTRLLSAAVGADGHVYALIPPPKPNLPDSAKAIGAIAADAHYGNITISTLSYAEPALGLSQQVDLVWTTNNYHDMHNALDEAGIVAFNKIVFDALKPGGAYIVIDHATAA